MTLCKQRVTLSDLTLHSFMGFLTEADLNWIECLLLTGWILLALVRKEEGRWVLESTQEEPKFSNWDWCQHFLHHHRLSYYHDLIHQSHHHSSYHDPSNKNLWQASAEQPVVIGEEWGLRLHQNQREVERLFLHQEEVVALDDQSSLWKTHQETTNHNSNNEETRN